MIAKSIKGSATAEIQSALVESMADEFKPTLAIVFISIHQDRAAVCEILTNQGIDILGATSSGEFIYGHQSQGEIVILLLDIPRDHFRILFCDTHNRSIPDAAQEIADAALAAFKNPAFILCSTCISSEGKMYDGTMLIHSIENALGLCPAIFGGMAGDDGTLTGTWIFTGKQSTDEGFTTLVLDHDKIDICGMAVSGWKPLGKVRTITRSEGDWIYAIDDQPALDMYLRYLGESQEMEGGTKNIFDDIGLYYPFLSLDAGEPVLRTPMMMDKEKNAIKLDFPMPAGKKLQFTMPPDFDIVESVLEHATAFKAKNNADADALLIFSCMGRLSALGPLAQQENDGLYELWNAPMAGFFTYGEYGNDINAKPTFNSTTCSWVALKEK